MNNLKYIINPINKSKILINTEKGKLLLKKYIIHLIGGADKGSQKKKTQKSAKKLIFQEIKDYITEMDSSTVAASSSVSAGSVEGSASSVASIPDEVVPESDEVIRLRQEIIKATEAKDNKRVHILNLQIMSINAQAALTTTRFETMNFGDLLPSELTDELLFKITKKPLKDYGALTLGRDSRPFHGDNFITAFVSSKLVAELMNAHTRIDFLIKKYFKSDQITDLEKVYNSLSVFTEYKNGLHTYIKQMGGIINLPSLYFYLFKTFDLLFGSYYNIINFLITKLNEIYNELKTKFETLIWISFYQQHIIVH